MIIPYPPLGTPSPQLYIYGYTLPSPGHSVLFSIVAPSPDQYIYGYTLPSPGHSVIISIVAPSLDQHIYMIIPYPPLGTLCFFLLSPPALTNIYIYDYTLPYTAELGSATEPRSTVERGSAATLGFTAQLGSAAEPGSALFGSAPKSRKVPTKFNSLYILFIWELHFKVFFHFLLRSSKFIFCWSWTVTFEEFCLHFKSNLKLLAVGGFQ